MKDRLAPAVAVAAVVLGLFLYLEPGATDRVGDPDTALTPVDERGVRGDGGRRGLERPDGPPRRTPEAPESPDPARDSAAGGSAPDEGRSFEVRGRALDLVGLPLRGLELVDCARPESVLARSGTDGSFRLTASGELRLCARGERHATVRAAIVERSRAARETYVVVAPAVALAGRVLDPEGFAVGGARFWLQPERRAIPGFPLPLDDTEPVPFEGRGDAEGRFALGGVPRISGRALIASAPGFAPTAIEVPDGDRSGLVVQLEREVEEPPATSILFGVVRLPDGRPAAGARVQLGGRRTAADDEGLWQLARPQRVPEGTLLAAMLEGYQAALFPDVARLIEPEDERVGPIELTLPGPELAITGRVERGDGAPAEGWIVQLLDPTTLDDETTPPATVELGGESSAAYAVTDSAGRFRITGLLRREYELRAWDSRTYASLRSDPVPAGTDGLVLRAPADPLLPRLVGTVQTQTGAPVARATVGLKFVTQHSQRGETWETPLSTRTDDRGVFELREVPRLGCTLVVSGSDVLDHEHAPPPGGFDGTPVEVFVSRVVRVQLDFSTSEPVPARFELHDAAGQRLMLESRSGNTRLAAPSMTLVEGRSGVVAVAEEAVTLVLLYPDGSRDTRAVQLAPGAVNPLR